jgi:hypothetical protein
MLLKSWMIRYSLSTFISGLLVGAISYIVAGLNIESELIWLDQYETNQVKSLISQKNYSQENSLLSQIKKINNTVLLNDGAPKFTQAYYNYFRTNKALKHNAIENDQLKTVSSLTDTVTSNQASAIKINAVSNKDISVNWSMNKKENNQDTKSQQLIAANFIGAQSIKSSNLKQQLSPLGNQKKTHIKVFEFDINNGEKKAVKNFDIHFLDSPNDYVTDHSSGEAIIKNKVDIDGSIRRITVSANNYMRTNHDLIIEDDDILVNIPLLSHQTVYQMAENNLIENYQEKAYLLVELDDHIEDVNIIGHGVHKIYLNRNYRVVNSGDSDYSYIMFLGAPAGNQIVSYKMSDNKVVTKIAHLTKDELHFDINIITKEISDQLIIEEYNLLSKRSTPLEIYSKNIIRLHDNSTPSKRGMGVYEFDKNASIFGVRSYYELKHLKESIFVGVVGSRVVKIPTEEVIAKVLHQFKITDFKDQCIVQIDLSEKVPRTIDYHGILENGGMHIELLALDGDGHFYSEIGLDTKKIFLKGEKQGYMGIRLDLANDTNVYLTSFCSDQTYLIEQL